MIYQQIVLIGFILQMQDYQSLYQMLGLIPVFHSSFSRHNGPEPFEVSKNSKCFLFERSNIKDAVNALCSAYLYSRSNIFVKRIGNITKDYYHEELISKF